MVNWEAYEAGIKKGLSRQLLRARYDVTPNAFDQLEEAFIFHVQYAWDTFKYRTKMVVTLRCGTCGRRRHLWGTFRRINANGGGVICGYGWWWGVHNWLPMVWWAGRHGED